MWHLPQTAWPTRSTLPLSEEAGRRSDPDPSVSSGGRLFFGTPLLIHDIPVIHRHATRDSPWRDSGRRVIVAFRDEERTSGNGRKFQPATTAEAGGVLRNASHGSDGWVLERGSVRRKPIPIFSSVQRNRSLRANGPRTGTDRGRKTSAGTHPGFRSELASIAVRQGPRRSLLRRDKPDPPRKDAKPSPARQFGPGTSGGW